MFKLLRKAVIPSLFFMSSLSAEPIRVGVMIHPVSGLIDLAESHGFFKDEGVEVRLERLVVGKDGLKKMLSGDLDLTSVYTTPVADYVYRGHSVRILTMLHQAKNNTGILALKSSNIFKPSDLEGKKIGLMFGTSAEYFLHLFARRYGINLNSVTKVDIPILELKEAFSKHKVDAVISWNPFLEQTKSLLGDKISTFYADIYNEFSLLAATKEIVETRPKDLSKFIKALFRAEKYYDSDSKRGLDEICKIIQQPECVQSYGPPVKLNLHLSLSNLLSADLNSELLFMQEQDRKKQKRTIEFLEFGEIFESKFLKSICTECVTAY